ncbi:MAG: FmdB family zinc ribbon protein [Micromonosporaceae bacterium]
MPTYQYACTACGHQLEAVQSFADDPLTECPACQGRLRKLFSSVGIVFKGSGFYRTDSRASNGSSSGGSGSDSSASSSGGTSSGAESGSGPKKPASQGSSSGSSGSS